MHVACSHASQPSQHIQMSFDWHSCRHTLYGNTYTCPFSRLHNCFVSASWSTAIYIGICFIPGHSNWCNKEPIVLQVSDGEWWLLGLEVYGGRDWALCACGTTHDCRVCVSIISRWRLKTYLFVVCIGDMTCTAGGTECMLGLCALCVWYGLITIVPGTSPRRGLGGQAPLLREVPPSPRGENSAVYCKV